MKRRLDPEDTYLISVMTSLYEGSRFCSEVMPSACKQVGWLGTARAYSPRKPHTSRVRELSYALGWRKRRAMTDRRGEAAAASEEMGSWIAGMPGKMDASRRGGCPQRNVTLHAVFLRTGEETGVRTMGKWAKW